MEAWRSENKTVLGAPSTLLRVTEAMATTTSRREKATERTDCENDWCNGPPSDTLPCFACFDPTREYDLGAGE